MFKPEQLNSLMKEVMESLEQQEENNKTNNKTNKGNRRPNQNNRVTLNPSQALVIAGLLTGTLQVISVLVDRDQTVQLVLSGSLRIDEQTELDRIMRQIGNMPFDEVMKAMLGKLR